MSSSRARLTALVLTELSETLPCVGDDAFSQLVDELLVPGRTIALMGVGRVLISLKAWVKRLAHLGILVSYVGEETEPPVGPGDLLIAASASGESGLVVDVARIAKGLGCRVAYIGCTAGSSSDALADFRLLLRARTKLSCAEEYPSRQPMSTLFEQELFLLGDVVALEVMARRNWTEDDIRRRHANLE